MAAQGKPLTGAPLSRSYIDLARRPARLLLAFVLVAYSSVATVVVVQGAFPDVAWWNAHLAGPFTIGAAIGVGIAALITLAELFLAEITMFGYLIVVACDAFLTYRFSTWAQDLLHSLVRVEGTIEDTIVLLLLIVASGAVAYFGERLLFGKRRRT
jgi:hypothetical protein